jgi:hypothetical protein
MPNHADESTGNSNRVAGVSIAQVFSYGNIESNTIGGSHNKIGSH